MKGIVVYYSGTGNTKKIARAIQGGMKEATGECDISSVKDIAPGDVANYDVIGIGAPIWYFREPANVRLFIHNMPTMEGKLCFTFCSHGQAPLGIFFSMVPALQKKGLTIIGFNDWYGSVYQVLHAPKPYVTDGHPDAIDLKEAWQFGVEMAGRAGRIRAGETGLIPRLPKGTENTLFKAQPLGVSFPPPLNKGADGAPGRLPPDFDFNNPPNRPERNVDMEKCLYPSCTLCVDICPAHSIDFSSGTPVVKKSCFNEALCDHLCPTGAIGVDEESLPRTRTIKVIDMTKCKYPACTLCVDHCPMDSIDFSVTPPVFKHSCEGDDLCWVICPEGAIEITNMDLTHEAMFDVTVMMRNSPVEHPFETLTAEAERKGKLCRATCPNG